MLKESVETVSTESGNYTLAIEQPIAKAIYQTAVEK
jgi:hypothetical protein